MKDPRNYCYRWAKLDTGRYGVFIEHLAGGSAGLWQLVAEFADEMRASWYAAIEEDFSSDRDAYDQAPYADEGIMISAASALPESALAQTRRLPPPIIPRPVQHERPRDRLSDRVCERDGCNQFIPEHRAARPKTKYCSGACADAVTKARLLAKQKEFQRLREAAATPPPSPARVAELEAIERHLNEKGATKGRPAYAAPTTH